MSSRGAISSWTGGHHWTASARPGADDVRPRRRVDGGEPGHPVLLVFRLLIGRARRAARRRAGRRSAPKGERRRGEEAGHGRQQKTRNSVFIIDRERKRVDWVNLRGFTLRGITGYQPHLGGHGPAFPGPLTSSAPRTDQSPRPYDTTCSARTVLVGPDAFELVERSSLFGKSASDDTGRSWRSSRSSIDSRGRSRGSVGSS